MLLFLYSWISLRSFVDDIFSSVFCNKLIGLTFFFAFSLHDLSPSEITCDSLACKFFLYMYKNLRDTFKLFMWLIDKISLQIKIWAIKAVFRIRQCCWHSCFECKDLQMVVDWWYITLLLKYHQFKWEIMNYRDMCIRYSLTDVGGLRGFVFYKWCKTFHIIVNFLKDRSVRLCQHPR